MHIVTVAFNNKARQVTFGDRKGETSLAFKEIREKNCSTQCSLR